MSIEFSMKYVQRLCEVLPPHHVHKIKVHAQVARHCMCVTESTMSLTEVRRFRADAIKHKTLIDHIRELSWEDVVELANAHGYSFSLQESERYFADIHSLFLRECAMTKTEIFTWQATGNPNAIVDEKMP